MLTTVEDRPGSAARDFVAKQCVGPIKLIDILMAQTGSKTVYDLEDTDWMKLKLLDAGRVHP